jgi:hypothetical protein
MMSIFLTMVLDVYIWRKNRAVKAGRAVIEGREGWLYTL